MKKALILVVTTAVATATMSAQPPVSISATATDEKQAVVTPVIHMSDTKVAVPVHVSAETVTPLGVNASTQLSPSTSVGISINNPKLDPGGAATLDVKF